MKTLFSLFLPLTITRCETIINKYISFFRDGHLYIYHEQAAAPINEDSIRRFFAGWPRVNSTEEELRRLLRTSAHTRPLEGIWINDNNDYRLGLFYIAGVHKAFVRKADSIYWLPGQVKFRIHEGPSGYKINLATGGPMISSTENLIIDLRGNDGAAGILDYANLNELDMPCPGYQLGYPTSRSKRIVLGKGIDNTGILPDFVLDEAVKDWVVYAQQYMEK